MVLKKLFTLQILTCFLLVSWLPAIGAPQPNTLRNIKRGETVPSFTGFSLSSIERIGFSANQGRPTLLIFFSIDPEFRQKRSLEMISQVSGILDREFNGRVDLIYIYSDDKSLETVKQMVDDGLLTAPVINDSTHNIYNRLGIFMMPLVVLVSPEGKLHEVIPATYNIGEIIRNNLKLLLGEWTKEEFQASFQTQFSKNWTTEEKEYIRRVNYGRVMAGRKMYSPAVREFATAIKIMPEAEEAYIGLGYVLLATKKWDKAAKAFTDALTHDPESDEALAGLGLTYYNKGDVDKALPILENALIAEKPKLEIIIALAEIHEERGNLTKAMRLNKLAIIRLRKKFK